LKVGGNCRDNVSTHLIEIYNIDTVIFAIFKAEKIHIVPLNVSLFTPKCVHLRILVWSKPI